MIHTFICSICNEFFYWVIRFFFSRTIGHTIECVIICVFGIIILSVSTRLSAPPPDLLGAKAVCPIHIHRHHKRVMERNLMNAHSGRSTPAIKLQIITAHWRQRERQRQQRRCSATDAHQRWTFRSRRRCGCASFVCMCVWNDTCVICVWQPISETMVTTHISISASQQQSDVCRIAGIISSESYALHTQQLRSARIP